MLQESRPDDRRLFGRIEPSIAANVAVRGQPLLPCIVRSFSDAGAMIEFSAPAPSTHTLRLVIAEHGVDVLCQVRHHTPSALGVSFVGGPLPHLVAKLQVKPATMDAAIAQALASGAAAPADAAKHSAPPAGAGLALIDRLEAALATIPEFAGAGFTFRGADLDLVIYQRLVRRGAWSAQGEHIVWTPADPTQESFEAHSSETAVLQTMRVVLSLLQRRFAKAG